MNRSGVTLLDLPNEILFYILRKLDNIDVLYSFLGINNDRLDRILREDTFSNTLDFASVIEKMTTLDRYCNEILPRIHSNVQCLIVKTTSMERILLASDYPNLTQLKVVHFQRDTSLHYFTEHSPLQNIFKQQITRLDLCNEDTELAVGSWKTYTKTVYAHLLTYFENLQYLSIVETLYPSLFICYLPANTFSSSILTYLNMKVKSLTDCLCLLDGRLKQLSTLIVDIYFMNIDLSVVHNLDDLPNLKCFSLTYYGSIEEYDDRIECLVRRMFNLVKLTLHLSIDQQRVFNDPVCVLNQFTLHLPQLVSFQFYFRAENNREDFPDYFCKNNIKEDYTTIGCQEVLNIVCFCGSIATHHVFTLPFEFTKLRFINNTFPNILFNSVTLLCVYDVAPVDHDFLLRIAKAFPLLQAFSVAALSIWSRDTQKSSDNTQSYSIVEYPLVTFLDISRTYTDYVEQFLNQNKTHLPSLTKLRVAYEELRIVTIDFTREETQHNCAKVTRLSTGRQTVGSKDYYIYFPLL